MDEIINTAVSTVISFGNNHPLITSIITCVIIGVIEGRIPEDKAEWKLFSRAIKKIGSLFTSDLKEEYASLNRKIDMNHTESIQRIDEVKNDLKKEQVNRKEDSIVILRDRITQMYNYYLPKGYMLEEDKKDFNSMFTRYVINGGNSYVQNDIAPFVKSLPRFKTHEEAAIFYEKNGDYNNGTENKSI